MQMTQLYMMIFMFVMCCVEIFAGITDVRIGQSGEGHKLVFMAYAENFGKFPLQDLVEAEQTVYLHALMRKHPGAAWFMVDDFDDESSQTQDRDMSIFLERGDFVDNCMRNKTWNRRVVERDLLKKGKGSFDVVRIFSRAIPFDSIRIGSGKKWEKKLTMWRGRVLQALKREAVFCIVPENVLSKYEQWFSRIASMTFRCPSRLTGEGCVRGREGLCLLLGID